MTYKKHIFLLFCMIRLFSYAQAMDELIEKREKPIIADLNDKEGLLFLALLSNDGHFLERMLQEGAKLNPFEKNNKWIKKATTLAVMRPLIDYCDVPDKYNLLFTYLMRYENDNFLSFFDTKPSTERANCLSWLLRQGIDPNKETDGLSPLMIFLKRAYIVEDNTQKEISLLISHGADFNRQDTKGRSAYGYARGKHLSDYVQLMEDMRKMHDDFQSLTESEGQETEI